MPESLRAKWSRKLSSHLPLPRRIASWICRVLYHPKINYPALSPEQLYLIASCLLTYVTNTCMNIYYVILCYFLFSFLHSYDVAYVYQQAAHLNSLMSFVVYMPLLYAASCHCLQSIVTHSARKKMRPLTSLLVLLWSWERPWRAQQYMMFGMSLLRSEWYACRLCCRRLQLMPTTILAPMHNP